MARERLFIAVALTEAARQELVRHLPDELPGRAVVPRNWHFTLQFLGDTTPATRERVIAELRAEPLGNAFPLSLAGLGAFPRGSRARVLWVRVTAGAPELVELARKVGAACARAGVETDDRPYSPHLTISRLEPPQNVRRLISGSRPMRIAMPVTEVLLLRSQLGSAPAVYEPLARFELAAGGE